MIMITIIITIITIIVFLFSFSNFGHHYYHFYDNDLNILTIFIWKFSISVSIQYPAQNPNAPEVFYRVIAKNGNGPPVFMDDLLQTLKVPLLLLWGDKDPWIRPRVRTIITWQLLSRYAIWLPSLTEISYYRSSSYIFYFDLLLNLFYFIFHLMPFFSSINISHVRYYYI